MLTEIESLEEIFNQESSTAFHHLFTADWELPDALLFDDVSLSSLSSPSSPMSDESSVSSSFVLTPPLDISCTIICDNIEVKNNKMRSIEKSMFARQRRRDKTGKFLSKRITSRLEELERELANKQNECNILHYAISQRNAKLDFLMNHLQYYTQLHPLTALAFPSAPQTDKQTNRFLNA